MPSLLRGRWLYLSLGVVVVFLYARLFLGGLSSIRVSSMKSMESVQEAFDQSSSSATRAELELNPATLLAASHRNPGVMILFVLWTLLGMGLGVCGLILSMRAVWRGKLPALLRYRSRLPYAWSRGEVVRLIALLVLVAGLLPFVHISLIAWGLVSFSDPYLWTLIAMFLLDCFLVLLVWGFATTKARSLASVLGLSWRTGIRAIAHGLVGYVAIFPWVFGLLWVIVQMCQQLGIRPPLEPIQELLFRDQPLVVVVLTVVFACVAGPIAEEIFFRGVVFAAVRKRTSRAVAILVSGTLFALAHANLIGFLPIAILGCFLAYLYERTGSLLAPITVHMAHNTFLLVFGLTVKALLKGG